MIDKAQEIIIQGKVNASLHSRIEHTYKLMTGNFAPCKILDLGPDNIMARHMREWGYHVQNTGLVDLDDHYENLTGSRLDVCTAFEILEHLRNPYEVLMHISCPILVASVPLNVWFAGPYWNEEDEWDTHYHEFHPKQFRSILKKTGWNIKKEEFWNWTKAPAKPRPLLRKYGPWPSWMAVICERK